MRLSLIFMLLIISGSGRATTVDQLPSDCRQCLVVTTRSWSATEGRLIAFERANRSGWQRAGIDAPVRIGRAGLAWGRGIVNCDGMSGPQKIEGDNRAPAGIFRFGTAFGYAQRPPETKMAYLPLSQRIVAVDDPASHFYNQLIDQSKVAKKDWRSAEQMILSDDRYKWGLFVKHNVPPKPRAGSCIFLHVWKNPETATTGCTAMPEASMLQVLRWLDPASHPLLVQLPARIYIEWNKQLHLPKAESERR